MFKTVFLKDNRFRLWLVGDGPLMEKIKTLADELEISRYVFFKGFIANPARLYFFCRYAIVAK
jgi:glycosyltransferase involved in cell wall biosynthesis